MLGILDPATEIALVIGLMSGALILLAAYAFSGMGSRRFTRRLREVTGRNSESARRGGPLRTPQRSLTRRESATPGIDRFFKLLPRRKILVARLSRTGREISVGQYMLGTLGVIL